MDRELEEFKCGIDLRQYAAAMDYTLDKRESWRGSAVMRRGADKIVIKRDTDGHYVYFSVRDDRDHGTIIDFIAHRQRLSLGEMRKELRQWTGRPASLRPAFPALETSAKDRITVEAEYHRMRDSPRHPYLERGRRLPGELLTSPRFAGRIRMDRRGNAVFPHFDEQGLCGYEMKNWHFTGFAKGGDKGLWLSHTRPDDRRFVFTESAIDAMSYAALHPDEQTRYASLGGKPNPKQPALIAAKIALMPNGAEIISAMDCDQAGRGLSQVVQHAVEHTGRSDLSFRTHSPAREGDDWNDVLKDKRAHSFPAARPQPPRWPNPGL